ncbi:MAG: LrgB family protein [Polyangiales bacterium]
MSSLWEQLQAIPIMWSAVTILVFAGAQYVFRRAGRPALMNPVLLSVSALCVVLVATGTDYSTYFSGAMPIHLMLGPATVALAIPLHQNAGRVRAAALPVAAALFAGSLTAILVAVGVAYAFGVSETTLLSIAPKSATTPVAIGISESVGGSATLTAVAVVLTGVGGAVIALPLLKLIRVKDWKARGFAMGLSAHGIGTAAAMDQDESGGAFAGLGMGMNALLTALLVPLLVALWRYL